MQALSNARAGGTDTAVPSAHRAGLERILATVGTIILRYGIVLFLVAFGLAKWTEAEANGIQPMVAHSPLLFWLYRLTNVRHGSEVIGVIELVIAAMMAVRPFLPRVSAWGSMLAIPMFLTTLSFLVTTPGVGASPSDSGFLMKDLILLGAACWTAAEAFGAARKPQKETI